MGNTEKQEKMIRILKERTPGEMVAAHRKRLGWSQEELSWRSGVSVTQIGKIERNMVNPLYETVELLEKALNIQLLDQFKKFHKEQAAGKKDGRSQRRAIKKFLQKVEEDCGENEGLEEYLEQAVLVMESAKKQIESDNRSEKDSSNKSENE